MNKKKRITLITAVLAAAVLVLVFATTGFAGSSLLNPGTSRTIAGSSFDFTLNVGQLKDSGSSEAEVEGVTRNFSVALSVSPEVSALSVKEGVGSVNAVNGQYQVSSDQLGNVSVLHFSVTPSESITSETTYTVSVSVVGDVSASDSFNLIVVPKEVPQEQTETPEETEPEETEPEETQEQTETPEETEPEEAEPEETQEQTETPEETEPEEAEPEETQEQAETPEETKPEETQEQAETPEETKPEETQKQAETPDTEKKPESQETEKSGTADAGKIPDQSMPGGKTAPSGKTQWKMPSGKVSVPSGGSGSAAQTASNLIYAGSWDNYLDSLSIDGYEFTRKFNKTRDTYFVKVPLEETSLSVEAEPSDSSASVAVTGNEDLPEGRSKIMVSVTADDGSVRVYRIYVDRMDEPEEEGANV